MSDNQNQGSDRNRQEKQGNDQRGTQNDRSNQGQGSEKQRTDKDSNPTNKNR